MEERDECVQGEVGEKRIKNINSINLKRKNKNYSEFYYFDI